MKVCGFSALMRHSMAWPENEMSLCARSSGSPAATRICSHQIDAGDRLRDRMLDLQAGVHLDEIELAVLVEELDGAGAAVAELAHGLGDTRADGLALGRVECRRQRLLPHLLVTALQRAVAHAEGERATLAGRPTLAQIG